MLSGHKKWIVVIATIMVILAVSSIVFNGFAGEQFDLRLLSIQVIIEEHFQVGLVLGGSMDRVDAAVDLFKQGLFDWMIVSDGLPCDVSTKGADEMKAHAIALGVPEGRIRVEGNAVNTIGNLYYAKTQFLIPWGWTTVLIITSDYHVPRTQLIAENLLGPAYHFAVYSVPCKSGCDAAQERERSLYMRHLIFFWLVPDGNHEFAKWLAQLLGEPIGCQ